MLATMFSYVINILQVREVSFAQLTWSYWTKQKWHTQSIQHLHLHNLPVSHKCTRASTTYTHQSIGRKLLCCISPLYKNSVFSIQYKLSVARVIRLVITMTCVTRIALHTNRNQCHKAWPSEYTCKLSFLSTTDSGLPLYVTGFVKRDQIPQKSKIELAIPRYRP